MQGVSLSINQSIDFDKAVKECKPAIGDVEIISKQNATTSGRPAVMVILEMENADGTKQKIRAVMHVRNLRNALSAVISAHSGEM